MTTKREMISSIREEWREEVGEDPGKVGAEIILDQLCEAFFHSWQGAGPEAAVRRDLTVAQYLAHHWKGEDGRRLRAEIASLLEVS